jgi:alanyl-tRNA synthetase
MSWTQKQIRRTFLDYFAQHTELPHREVDGSPLIPRDDPTLLFCNAGMNQFKSTLLGEEKRDYTRACSVQKCVRAGGKHNDLDAVGKNGRHLTLFEMLGNWSFGDYYKKDAIRMSWDLTINGFGLDEERVYVSVYKDDDESYDIWRDEIGVPESRIYRLGDLAKGDDENFWSMGPTGPCGPCTELFYDLGPEGGTGPEDYMGGEGDRYMEFWNNVFMQSNRGEDGTFSPLAIQSVDTGLGLDRMAMILQGKANVFDTDLFQPIIQQIARLSGADADNGERRVDMQVIADHLRTLMFVVSEGGQFSNEGRGYVLRRILRRAVRHGRRLGFDGPFLSNLMPTVADVFEGVYEFPSHILANTGEALADEENRFFRTIDRGMGRIHSIMKSKSVKCISGTEAFELYDTFGFPVGLTKIEASEHGFTVDIDGFNTEMAGQQAKSKKAAKFHDQDGGEWTLIGNSGGRGFAGYGLTMYETIVMRHRQSAERVEFILDRTPFYAESGGEVADHGWIEGPGFNVVVDDVQKLNGIIHHYGRLTEGSIDLSADDYITATVDVERRHQKRIHHTATHLMHSALQEIVGMHVEQKGSVVEPNRLRFDYSHGKSLTQEEIVAIEAWVNQRIRANTEVVITEDVSMETAKAMGAVGLFGEKYGDSVRTVKAGNDSFELCGGNHANRTGDIGAFRITVETGVAAGVRRIEAVVGHAADTLGRAQRALIADASTALKTDPARLLARTVGLLDEIKQLKKALEKARKSGGGVDVDALVSNASDLDGVPLVAVCVEVDSRPTLISLIDRLRDKLPGGVIVLGAEVDGAAVIIAAIGPELKGDKRFHAGQIVKDLTSQLDGRGGGRPDFAQGGGKNVAALASVMAQLPAALAGK